MYCICCKKNKVTPVSPQVSSKISTEDSPSQTEEDVLWKKERRKDGSFVNVNNEMIDGGIIHIIDAGYGSLFDGSQFIISICDDCILENLEDATLLYYGNYMTSYEHDNSLDLSKQRYRRRKNLDDIV